MKKTDTISIEEIKGLISSLKQNPITETWKPQGCGVFTVQRVESNQVSGKCSIVNKNEDGSENLFQEQCNGVVAVIIGSMPNTPWFIESGATYLAWKEQK